LDEHVIGIDFGTDSVRSVVVNARTGEEVSQAVSGYRRWGEELYCGARENRYRQHPLDHIEALFATLEEALSACPAGTREAVRGISADTTGSTPGPVDRDGMPLALDDRFAEDPDAMFVLWKDHTALAEAEEITAAARSWGGPDYTMYEGGFYSAEWFWSKLLHVFRASPAVREAAYSWVEHSDWVPAFLAGKTDPRAMKRNRCAAGHKAMWHASFGGLPPVGFFDKVDPMLADIRERLYTTTVTSDTPVGTLLPEWADRLGLSTDVIIGTGAIDAHMGAVGAGIRPYVLTKVVGTSTCDMLVAPPGDLEGRQIRGICGQVDGSMIPGMIGMEAGQSAFGDVFAWFRDLLAWPLESGASLTREEEKYRSRFSDELMDRLHAAASAMPPGPADPLALDWINGRRTPDADLSLNGAITGLSLGTDAPSIFKALVDATAFGSRSIVERFRSEGVAVEEVIALGGIARKAPLVMQTLADVLDMTVKVSASEQTCALGAAMFAATASGIYPDISQAQDAMGCGFDKEYRPRPESVRLYDEKYRDYLALGDSVERLHRKRNRDD